MRCLFEHTADCRTYQLWQSYMNHEDDMHVDLTKVFNKLRLIYFKTGFLKIVSVTKSIAIGCNLFGFDFEVFVLVQYLPFS